MMHGIPFIPVLIAMATLACGSGVFSSARADDQSAGSAPVVNRSPSMSQMTSSQTKPAPNADKKAADSEKGEPAAGQRPTKPDAENLLKMPTEAVQPRTDRTDPSATEPSAKHLVNSIHMTPEQIAAVRRGFPGNPTDFTPQWYERHPAAWPAPGIAPETWWVAPSWKTAYGWIGGKDDPISYDYGANVTYRDGSVYYGEQPAADIDRYFKQASELVGFASNEGKPPKDAEAKQEWLALGLFALVSEGQTRSDKTLQIAINKDGIVRGNLSDEVTNLILPLQGAVDKPSQRMAFQLVANDAVILECGLWNLTQETASILIHFGPQRTEVRGLIRLTLEQPSGGPAK